MSTSVTMKAHLAKKLTTLAPCWTMVAKDGTRASYVMLSRPLSGRAFNNHGAMTTRFTFNGIIYKPAGTEPARPVHSIGLSPNSVECTGIFDNIVTDADIKGGRWKQAAIRFEFVNYLDLTMGSTDIIAGYAGKFDTLGRQFTVELRSKAALLHQLIGDLTSPIDRNAFPAGVNPADFTFAHTIVSSSDMANFVIDGVAKPDDYWKYGLVSWTTGANTGEPPMDIKSSTGNAIELQLPMRSIIAPSDEITLLAGYDGTREQSRDRYNDAIDLNSEPDLPGLKKTMTYPN